MFAASPNGPDAAASASAASLGRSTSRAADFGCRSLAAALVGLLDEIDTGVVLCDERGCLLVANHAARLEIAAGVSLCLLNGELHAPGVDTFGAVLRNALASRRRQLLMLGGADARLLAYLLPLPGQADGHDGCVALLLGRRGRRSDLAVELLASLFHLTGSEREVLASLAAGKRVVAIARERGVALSTVRSQIMAVRQKLGAGSITALIGMVAEMPPIAPALRHCGAPLSLLGGLQVLAERAMRPRLADLVE